MAAVIVTFFMDAVKNEFRSEEDGRDIYDDLEHISKIVAGSRDRVVRLATPEDKREFPEEYKSFKERLKVPVSGTPLRELPGIAESFAKEMEFFHVRTIEELAQLDDNLISRMGPGVREKITRAQGFLAASTGDAANVAKIASENEKLKARVEELETQAKANKVKPAQTDDDASDGKLTPEERGLAAGMAGKDRNVPPAYRGKPEADEWLKGFDAAA
jgi:hypothetical protein